MDRATYDADVCYWDSFFKDVLNDSSVKDWQPWANTAFSNYVEGDDDIVIYSLYSPSKLKGVTIQQQVGKTGESPSLHIITRSANVGFGAPIKHLVVICTRDSLTENFIKEAAKIWFLTDLESLFAEAASSQSAKATS